MEAVGADYQLDEDGDGVFNDVKIRCPNTPCWRRCRCDEGCADSDNDNDGDGVSNDADQCPNKAGRCCC